MHLFLIIVFAILVANWIMDSRHGGGCGCLLAFLLILVLLANCHGRP